MSAAIGRTGLTLGQIKDLEKVTEKPSLETLMEMTQLKTGLAIEASLIPPAILSGQTPEKLELLKKFARNIGLIFQIRDDLLDVIGDSKETGKDTQIDSKNDTQTYVKLLGIEGTEKLLEMHRLKALTDLKALEPKAPSFKEIVNWAARRMH